MTTPATPPTSTPPAAQPAPQAPTPCPFCGGKPLIWKHLETDQWAVSCQDCEGRNGDPSTLNGFTYEADAIAAWNHRAPDPSRAALVAALRGMIPCCQETLRDERDYKECGRPAFYYASYGMHVCEKCATPEQLKRTTPELQAARQALALADAAGKEGR